MRHLRYSILALLVLVPLAYAGSTRIISVDQFKSADQTKTWSLPAVSGTLSNAITAVQDRFTTCNGSNTGFTLSNTPGSNAAVSLFLDGTLLSQGAGLDYTISGVTITLSTACSTGQILYAVYTY